jgi:hypothetical protein
MDVDSARVKCSQACELETWLVCAHIKDWEILKDRAEFLVKRFLCKFDFPHVKVANSADFEVFVDNLNAVHQAYEK